MEIYKLRRVLNTVGMKCFVQYFYCFSSHVYSKEDIVEKLSDENEFTLKSCRTRASAGLRIFRESSELIALKEIVTSKRVAEEIRVEANKILIRNSNRMIDPSQFDLIAKLQAFNPKDSECRKVYCSTCGGYAKSVTENVDSFLWAEIADFISSKSIEEIYLIGEWGELLLGIKERGVLSFR